MDLRERSIQHEMRRCVHFSGIHHDKCRAGVAYATVKNFLGEGRIYPCVAPEVMTCASRQLPTQEQAEVLADQAEEHHRAFMAKIALGVCASCDVEAADFKQVGKCIYAMPCGHRVGQGNAAEYQAGVDKARGERKP
jgi:hypothetical protein